MSQMDLALPSDTDGTWELFLWDQLSGSQRITSSNGNVTVFTSSASISADGTKIAFTGKGNYDPVLQGNTEGADEVFFYDTADPFGQILQLTDFSDLNFAGIFSVASDATGRWVAFNTTTAGIPGWPNPEHDREIVVIDRNLWVSPTDPAGFVFATQALGACPDPVIGVPGSCDSRNASVNADGSRIAFQSDESLTGGSTNGNAELFRLSDCLTTGCTLSQLTSSPLAAATAQEPSIDGTGDLIAIWSSLNLDASAEPGATDGNAEIFVWDGTGPSPTVRRVTLTTSVPGDNLRTNQTPLISGDGGTILFLSHADLVPGSNTDGSLEAFLAVEPEQPVGGIAELPGLEAVALEADGSSGWSVGAVGAIAGIAAGAVAVALGGAAWFARSRWVRR